MKKFTLEKKNLFGVYDYNPEMYTAKNEPKSGNPTFLSSLKGIWFWMNLSFLIYVN